MDRRVLAATTSRIALVDANGTPLPKAPRQPVNIPDLPLIAPGVFVLPPGIEARLCMEDLRGYGPEVVLWSPEHEASVCVPVVDGHQVEEAAEMMVKALPKKRRGRVH